jgi:hypothetical protein
MTAQSCPVDGTKVNEPVVRIVAILVAILAVAGILLNQPVIFGVLIYDFLVRGFIDRKYSILRLVALQINNVLNFKEKHIDAAPKTFAAKIGFIFSVIIFIALLLNWTLFATVTTTVLLICALLEGVFGYCVGCEFYFILQKLKLI